MRALPLRLSLKYAAPARQRLTWLVALLTFLNGLLGLIALSRHGRPLLDSDLLPVAVGSPRLLVGLAVSLGLIFFSVQLVRRKRVAWLVAISGTSFLTLSHLFFNRDLAAAAVNLLSAWLLIFNADQFKVKSDTGSMRQSALAFTVITAAVVFYGAVGFLSLGKTGFDRPVGPVSAVEAAAREYANLGSGLRPQNRLAGTLVTSLNFLGLVSAGLVFYSLFKPLRFRLIDAPADRRRAETILAGGGSDLADDFFGLWPRDKRYFFNHDKTAFIAYRVVDAVALALNRPYGRNPDGMIGDFVGWCRLNGWEPAFIYCDGRFSKAMADSGLKLLKIGQTALIDVGRFASQTIRNKHFRYVFNKFKRLNYQFKIIEPDQINGSLIRRLRVVSSAWLRAGKISEKGFAMGYFNGAYLRRCRLAVVISPKARIEAFANLVPVFQSREASVDLIRFAPEAPGNSVDFLIASLIVRSGEEGYERFDLGLAPLAGLERSAPGRAGIETRALSILRSRGGFLYGFSGVERFKAKFDPEWQDRYVAYAANPYAAARVAIALNKAMSPASDG